MKDLKQIVQDKYGAIARRQSSGSCCDPQPGCCGDGADFDVSIMAEDYGQLQGYFAGADLQLGCGLPTQFAHIKPGDTVVDLGSGAGNDCFVARAETGPTGQVIGVDFTDDMLAKAQANVAKLGFDNVRFIKGDIEQLPLPDAIADVVVSNCVFNLVPDKQRAFAETYRILKPGGHFSISDIVLTGELPAGLKEAAALYAGCVSGALQMEDYLRLIREAGFTGLEIQKKKAIALPQEVLDQYLSAEEQTHFNQKNGIFSISVYAVR
jgi:ubiquinone/menaquinone biosynthesis C-methylase UbiE